jgi:predicted dehydrogenase
MGRIKIGVVGCGAIAQVHHLPNLAMLQELFEVTVVCDISPSLAAAVATRFHVPDHVTDYCELLAADVDAVLLCHGDPKTEAALATLEAGKHLFIENRSASPCPMPTP